MGLWNLGRKSGLNTWGKEGWCSKINVGGKLGTLEKKGGELANTNPTGGGKQLGGDKIGAKTLGWCIIGWGRGG